MNMSKRLQLFFDKVKVDPETGCWLWQGYVTVHGYGQFWNGDRLVGAHVFGYEAHKGPVPDGLDLDHLCRVRRCVNPDHLEAVTRRENLLRGLTIPAAKAAQTHCEHGHEFTEANTYRGANGKRSCRICRRDGSAQWAATNRERRRELDRQCYARKVGKTPEVA